MPGFGLADIKKEGWSNEYDGNVSYDGCMPQFEKYYEENGRKYIPRSTHLDIWRAALSATARKER